ncbi:MAG: hypothetical protein JO053_02165, partial [Acidobacteria bacterium]|nr:hypothetical protein [Acidobacteriota bacterium]
MRRALGSALLYVLTVTAIVPANAQATHPRQGFAGTGDIVKFTSITAESDGTGALIKWRTSEESGSIGFLVFRLSGSSRELVNDRIILGSAARLAGNEPVYDQQYQVFDPEGTPSTNYLVQNLSTSGEKLDSPVVTTQKVGRTSPSALMGQGFGEDNGDSSALMERQYLTSGLAATATPNLTNQRLVASQPGVKIAVRREGYYRVTKAELQSAGFDTSSNSNNWQLFADGNEQGITVGPSNSYIEFYGRPVDTPESETHEYYLIAGSSGGKRIGQRPARTIAGNVIAGSMRVNTEMRDRVNHVDTIFNGNAEDWYGALINNASATSVPTSVPFSLTGIDGSAAAASLTVKLNGFTEVPHSVNVSVNGHTLGTMTGSGSSPYQATFSVPTSYLLEGPGNRLGLLGASQGDFSFVDTISVNFARKFQPEQNRLVFSTQQGRRSTVGPFSSPIVSTVTIMDGQQLPNNIPTAVSSGPGPGALRLGSPTYTYGEVDSSGAANVARLTIYRVFGNTGSVGVNVTLANGSATGGTSCNNPNVDYVFPASSTVTIPDGSSSANVDVQLCKDNLNESPETFTATLSTPTGGATLATNNIRVLDTTFDGAPQQIPNLTFTTVNGSISFDVPAFRASSLYAFDETYVLRSPEVTANAPSTLTSSTDSTNAADMLIITASLPGFAAAANTWANYRRSQGYTVKVVDVADIMDEFSYGTLSSDAIKQFLSYAKANWSIKPRYVMLLGDASYDPKNYLGWGFTDYIPTKVVTGVYSRMASDEALADFDGDGLAEMAVGRIPVRRASDITTIYNKTVHFEGLANLSRGGVFVYDQPLNPGDDFQTDSLNLRNQVSNMSNAVLIDRGASNQGLSATLAALSYGPTGQAGQPGPYIANWSGHG